MTKDIWEELEKKYTLQGYDDSSVIINYETLIRLDEKAEKWDLLESTNLEQRDKALLANQELIMKLESVKNWYDRFIDNKTIFDSDEAITIFMSEFKELDKILEAEG